ncbi:MAG: PAS sensor protein [Bacteroidales bacterium]|nr:PAS sensor protein [Bacteroidales bacterium]
MENDFFKEVNFAVTITDKEGNVVYQNDSSVGVNGDVRGKNMMGCHNERSQQIIRHLLNDAATNVYTISKKGKKKLIYQTPWYENGEVCGLVELSIIITEEMPHYDRG